MDGKESDQRQHHYEMQRPRRLAPAEDIEQPERSCVEARRHRKPGQDHQRQKDEHYPGIGQLLQGAVAAPMVKRNAGGHDR
jgi:hypothetical protein